MYDIGESILNHLHINYACENRERNCTCCTVSGKKGALGGTWEPAIIDPGLYTMTDIAADFSLHAAERDNIAGFLPE